MSNRRRRRPVHPRESVVSMPLDELDDFLKPRDIADMRRVTDLEAAGDLAGALAALRRAVRVLGSGQERHLAEMVRLGDDAPPWVWGRWLCGIAYQWALFEQDPRVSVAILDVFAIEKLYEQYVDRGFAVLGFPCNQFGGQEPGTAEEIQQFCSTTWGVTFPLFEKVDVTGADRHPLFDELTETADSQGKAGDVTWNFEKFLVSSDGIVAARFRTGTEPDDPALLAAVECDLAA